MKDYQDTENVLNLNILKRRLSYIVNKDGDAE